MALSDAINAIGLGAQVAFNRLTGRGVPNAVATNFIGPDQEFGWGGTPLVSGIIQEDHNIELRGRPGVVMANKMRRTDSQIRSVTAVISLPIRSTKWFIDAGKDAGSAETEAADILQANLFGGMETSWDSLLREATQSMYHGYGVPEIVWEDQQGVLGVKKIAPRNRELVERWLTDEYGRTVGYVYVGNRPQGVGVVDSYYAPTIYQRVPIPLEKTLHLVYDQENDNPAGFGLWRSMYGPWYIKQALYKIMAIGVERNLLGVPYAETPETTRADDQANMLTLLMRMRAAEDGAFVTPHGWVPKWFESSRNPMDAMPFIHHLDAKMAQVALAQFLELGQGERGSQALASEQVRVFMDAEEAAAKWIEETVNTQLVARWVQYNYGDGAKTKFKAPQIRHRKIGMRSLEALAGVLQQLTSGGWVHPEVDDEEFMRDLADLPAIPIEQLAAQDADRKAQAKQQAKQQADAQVRQAVALNPKDPTVTDSNEDPSKTASECEHAHRFDDPKAERAARVATEGAFTAQAQEILSGIQSAYLDALKPILQRAEKQHGPPISELTMVSVPRRQEYQRFVNRFLWQVFNEGRQAIQNETGDEVTSRPVPDRIRQWVNARAAVIASSHLSQVQTTALDRVLAGFRSELSPAVIFSDAGAEIVEGLNRAIERDWAAAAQEICDQVSQESGG